MSEIKKFDHLHSNSHAPDLALEELLANWTEKIPLDYTINRSAILNLSQLGFPNEFIYGSEWTKHKLKKHINEPYSDAEFFSKAEYLNNIALEIATPIFEYQTIMAVGVSGSIARDGYLFHPNTDVDLMLVSSDPESAENMEIDDLTFEYSQKYHIAIDLLRYATRMDTRFFSKKIVFPNPVDIADITAKIRLGLIKPGTDNYKEFSYLAAAYVGSKFIYQRDIAGLNFYRDIDAPLVRFYDYLRQQYYQNKVAS